MQQRRLRLGDVLDDYCPRERRITNHVVLAMIDDTVKQTRCSTCDADHEYKQAKTPARRRKTGVAPAQLVDSATKLPDAVEAHDDEVEALEDDGAALEAADVTDDNPEIDDDAGEPAEQPELAAAAEAAADVEGAEPEDENVGDESENWPVHRPLIRAQLPRPEGHVPERKAPDFTMRQGGKFDQNRNGQRFRGGGPRQGRQAFGQSQPGQGSPRFGGQRGPGGPGGPGGGRPGQGQGNRPGQGGRPGQGQGQGQGQGRGPRPPGGGGRKRGR